MYDFDDLWYLISKCDDRISGDEIGANGIKRLALCFAEEPGVNDACEVLDIMIDRFDVLAELDDDEEEVYSWDCDGEIYNSMERLFCRSLSLSEEESDKIICLEDGYKVALELLVKAMRAKVAANHWD